MMALILAAQLTLGATTETLEGVTSDGKFLVGSTESSTPYDQSHEYWYEAVGGERTTFSEDEKASFEAWKKKVKLVPPLESRASPDGKTTIEVVMKPKAATKDDVWINTSAMTVLARTGPRKLELFQTSSSFTVAWTADSRGLIITTREPTLDYGPRGSVISGTNVQITSWVPAMPSVTVVAPTRKLAIAAARSRFDDLEVNVHYGAAMKKRASTVVYFRKEHEALARKLATRFTGATTEALTWDSAFDVVVALGGAR